MTLAQTVLLNSLADSPKLLYDVTCPMHGVVAVNLDGHDSNVRAHDHNLQFHVRALRQSYNAKNYW